MDTQERREGAERRRKPRSSPDRRRGGRKPRATMTFARFAEIGRNVSLGERANITIPDLADLSGMSVDKLLSIGPHYGAFKHPAYRVWQVPYESAARLLRELRLID